MVFRLLAAGCMVGWVLAGVLILPGLLFSQSSIDKFALTGEGPELAEAVGEYYGKKIPVPPAPTTPAPSQVLGDTTTPFKRIEVDLTNQKLYTYEGDRKIHEFLISSGKWGRTPTGTFQIWHKTLSTKMEGGSKALRTYYYLPKVPYTMFFYNQDIPMKRGYGIHGAYWHNNFGHPMSHGCINMKPEEAGIVFQWANPVVPGTKRSVTASPENPGTTVVIYGTAPLN